MKFINLLPLAALTSAFVIPDEQVMSEVKIESHGKAKSLVNKIPTKDQAITDFENTFSKLIDTSKSAFDQTIDYAAETSEEISTKVHDTAFDAQAWLEVGVSWSSEKVPNSETWVERICSLAHVPFIRV